MVVKVGHLGRFHPQLCSNRVGGDIHEVGGNSGNGDDDDDDDDDGHHCGSHHPPCHHLERSQSLCRMTRRTMIRGHPRSPAHLFYNFAIIDTHHPLADDDDDHDHGDHYGDHNCDDHHSHHDCNLPWCSDCWKVEAGGRL